MSVSKTTRDEVYERDGRACVRCASTFFLTVDHIVPKSKGGNDKAVNLQTLCLPCNAKKGNRVNADDKTPERMRPAPKKQRGLRLLHHRACDERYCFCECPVYLAEHPEFERALRSNPA